MSNAISSMCARSPELVAGLATRQNAVGLVVNICAGRTWRLRALVDDMIRLAGKPVSLDVDPHRVRAGEPAVLCGHTGRLVCLGLAPALPDFDRILPELLAPTGDPAGGITPTGTLDQPA